MRSRDIEILSKIGNERKTKENDKKKEKKHTRGEQKLDQRALFSMEKKNSDGGHSYRRFHTHEGKTSYLAFHE